ncbi:hypothetical protein [Parachitinimonas caeni]|uniref:Uncharacterized protein n=1 Tax=Parachitinimonas caeni TaxID=3031301 RepID=A0ABT7DRV2_9NEIS|nr:hypothetical protein [Parachitinimonas caeni]MDK2122796.1 hypothetical protein [Parachitinimonas caeni]
MMKKKILASAVATTFVAGMLASGSAHAVRMSENGSGQVLLGAQYLARAADYTTTRIRVVNPSLTDAVKARLSLRSKKHSDECFDTVLYLTPGDVAYLDLRLSAAGKPEVWTDDDSILASRSSDGSLKFASQVPGGVTFPINESVVLKTEPTADSCAQGHIEVVGAYSAAGVISGLASGLPNVTVRQTMSKFEVIRIFDTPKGSLNIAGNNVTNNPAIGTGPADHAARVQLSGFVETIKSDDRIATPMSALRDGINPLTAGAVTYVIGNPLLDPTVGNEVKMGQNFGSLTGGTLNLTGTIDTINDIEAGIASSNLRGFYENNGGRGLSMEVTFPTKYRHQLVKDASGKMTYGAPFHNYGEIGYATSLFDNQENSAPATVSEICVVSPCPIATISGSFLIHEVNYNVVTGATNWNPSSGWYSTNLSGVAGAPRYDIGVLGTAYAGIPTIGYTHYFYTNTGTISRSIVEPLNRNNNVGQN